MERSVEIAMNTIPSIFNEHKVSYAVVGGAEKTTKVLIPATCVVLSRNGKYYRSKVFENLLQKGFSEIISVNIASNQNNIDSLARQFPTIKFLVVLENVSQGELLNIAFSEASENHVLVLQEELCLDKLNFNSSMALKLIQKKQFCIVPKLFSSTYVKLPTVFLPSAKKSVFNIEVGEFSTGEKKTLYPADYVGFYDREKFILLGGFDYTIFSEFWQKVDFFFRAWLWGEKIFATSELEFVYAGQIPEENQTVDISYLRFYLKNLLPVFYYDHAKIPWYSYFTFKLRSSCGFFESLRQLRDAIKWTEENRYRFKMDAVSLIENWEK